MKPSTIALLLGCMFLFCFAGTAFGQSNPENAHASAKIIPVQQPYARFAAGLLGGITLPYMDVNGTRTAPVFGGNLSFQPLSYLRLTGDLQRGKLKSQNEKEEVGHRSFVNNYYYAALTVNIYPFKIRKYPTSPLPEFLDYIYVGTGMAVIKNKGTWRHIRKNTTQKTSFSGTAFLIPVAAGLNIPVWKPMKERPNLLTLDLNYRQHFSFSDELDGINPKTPANKKNDIYSQLTVGLSFHF